MKIVYQIQEMGIEIKLLHVPSGTFPEFPAHDPADEQSKD